VCAVVVPVKQFLLTYFQFSIGGNFKGTIWAPLLDWEYGPPQSTFWSH